jgi:hypothetical protein
MAEAVLTPRDKDLESGIWTQAAPFTKISSGNSRAIGKREKPLAFDLLRMDGNR